jgi:catechol 2,3-dioxygenase-like lactoylglutathione lyase family enzyme
MSGNRWPGALAMAMAVAAIPAPAASAGSEPAQAAPAPGHVTGIGGIFLKAKDPKALAAWYRDVLGMPVEAWGGAALHYDAPKHPPVAVWTAFPASTAYFAPSTSDFMINYAVDDMDALLARVKTKGVDVLKRVDDDPNGRFAWLLDPEGHKIELWEPKRTAAPAP